MCPTQTQVANFNRYTEFFADFCLQELLLLKEEPLKIGVAVIGITRKHMNLETVWTEEMVLLTNHELH